MATRDEEISTTGYTSTARKVMSVGAIGTVLQSAVEVSDAATLIPASNLTSRKALLIYNNGSNTVYLGTTTVTAVNGYPLAPGAEKSFDATNELALYGITESGTSDVRILEAS